MAEASVTSRDASDRSLSRALEALRLDCRHAYRALRSAPALSGIVILTLALGIGAVTAIFSVVHTVLLRPLPYHEADRLMFVWLNRAAQGYPRGVLSGPDLGGLRDGTRTFVGFGGIWASGTVALEGDGEPEQLRGALVTTNFFQVLGADAALGRTFRPEDSAPGAEATILIGWDLFQRRFGGDASIVGRRIIVNDAPATVIGVMPRDFRLLLPPAAAVPDGLQAFAPFWPDLESGPPQNMFLRVVGRMKPGVTVAAAGSDIAAAAEQLSTVLGMPRAFTPVPLQDESVREIRRPLLALFAGVGILLMIACVNVAGLLIAHAATRANDTAVRLALGIRRGRLLRQALIEGLLLTTGGALLGVALGAAGVRVLMAQAPEDLTRLGAVRIDPVVVAFAIGVSLVWGVLLSLAPAFELTKADVSKLMSKVRQRGASQVRYRVRAGLVVVQVASSIVLLVSAGLLARAFAEVLAVDPGFRADSTLTFRIGIPGRYGDRQAFNTFNAELRQRIADLPTVTSVGAISHLPYDDMPNWTLGYGLVAPLPGDAPAADARAIGTGLFETLGVRLVEGRLFTDHDDNGRSPVVIVDDRLARELWPGRSAIGQQLVTTTPGMNADVGTAYPRLSVVGVVRHLRLRSLVDDLGPQLFVPWRMAQRNPIAYAVRTSGDPDALVPRIRETLAALDPRAALYDARPLDTYVDAARSTRRFVMQLAAVFALSALALTCIGVYGVLAFTVAMRRHELGVRGALGATAGRLTRDVLSEGLRLAAIGCAGGLILAAMLARLLQSQLYAVEPGDPLAYAAAVLLVMAGAIAACWIPAYRVATIDPLDALRAE